MTPAVRDAVLAGTRAAADTHHAFRMQDTLTSSGGTVDVFGTIDELGIPLFFTPLDKLLGACVRISPGIVGILVTTQRDLHMQRFTAAHELGHFLLEHQGSLDAIMRLPGQFEDRDPQEAAADAFAAEFLLPKWLYRAIARRHGWTRNDLDQADQVYQLSLRLGASYEATCWGLASQNIISASAARSLALVRPKDCKWRALDGVPLDDPWADVWVLGPSDSNVALTLGPTDIVVLSLEEQAGAGYLWNREALESSGFQILRDDRTPTRAATVGGPLQRRLVARAPAAGRYNVQLALRRPWLAKSDPLKVFDLNCSTFGAAQAGEYQRPEPIHFASAH